MSTILIEYNSLQAVSNSASNLAKKAQEYADALSRKVTSKFGSVPGGGSGYLSNASYLVNQKINDLGRKAQEFESYSNKVKHFAETAKRVDGEVKTAILNNQNAFVDTKQIAQPGWKQTIIEWLVDMKNNSFLFSVICDVIDGIGNEVSGLLDNIRYWYKCEGGKEFIQIGLAIAGVIVAVLLFVAALPALAAISGFLSAVLAISGVIGAAIGIANAITNLVTSCEAYGAYKDGDAAWAKIYGDRNTFTQAIREHNFKSARLNNLMDKFAYGLDIVDNVCAVINLIEGITKIASKLQCVKNYFGKETGLLAYMKEAQWGEFTYRDELTGQWSVRSAILVDDYGNVKTKFTVRSVFRGLKAYVTNDHRITNNNIGLRTYLNLNLMDDLRDFGKSISITGIKDTIRYQFAENRWIVAFQGMNATDTNVAAKAANAWKSISKSYKITSFKELTNLKSYANVIKGGTKIATNITKVMEGTKPDYKTYAIYKIKDNTIGGQVYKKGEDFHKTFSKTGGNIKNIFKKPEYSVPDIPKISVPSIQSTAVNVTSIPKIAIPKMTIPQINKPSFISGVNVHISPMVGPGGQMNPVPYASFAF